MSSLATSVSTGESQPRPDRRRVLVIDADLLIAEAVTSALVRMTFAARFAMPINSAHLHDLAAWQPGVALLNVDTGEPVASVAVVTVLSANNVPVAILSSRSHLAVVEDCMAAGASTVVDRGCALDELVQVITHLMDSRLEPDGMTGRRILNPLLRQASAQRRRMSAFDVLTPQEKWVLAELMDGADQEIIARRNSTSILMVRSQIKSILQKLGVNSQLAAVSLARRAGWTTDGMPATGRRDGPPPPAPGPLFQSA